MGPQSPNPRKTGSAGAPASPIEHVVIIVKENHTFDNYFGTFPGAAGATETGLALFLRFVTPFIHHLRGAAVQREILVLLTDGVGQGKKRGTR